MTTLSTRADELRESVTADLVAHAWGVTLHRFARFDPIDWWVEQRERMVAVAEHKERHNLRGAYPTTYLSLAKWQALRAIGQAFDVAPLYVVGFDDSVAFVDVRKVIPDHPVLRGRFDRDRRDAPHDVEPMIEVPIDAFTLICER